MFATMGCMNEMKSEKVIETPKQEKIDSVLRPGVVTRLQREYKDVLENPANIRIKEHLQTALTSEDDEAAEAAFAEARNGLLQLGILTWPKLHKFIALAKRAQNRESR